MCMSISGVVKMLIPEKKSLSRNGEKNERNTELRSIKAKKESVIGIDGERKRREKESFYEGFKSPAAARNVLDAAPFPFPSPSLLFPLPLVPNTL